MFHRQPRARSLILLFMAVSVAFLAATFFAEYRASGIDNLAYMIASDAAPGIRYLAAARSDLNRLEDAVEDHLSDPTGVSAPSLDDVQRAWHQLQRSLEAYRKLPLFSGEREIWEQVENSAYQVDQARRLCIERLHARDLAAAETVVKGDFRKALEDCSAALQTEINFNVRQAEDLAGEIKRARFRSALIAFGLDAFCILLAIAAGILAARTVKNYTAVMESLHGLNSRRAEELEFFAGRVAHDILSPLQAVELGLDLVAARTGADPDVDCAVRRAKSSLKRVEVIVKGLLDFARAGASPTPGARTAVHEVLDPLVADLAPAAAEAGAELRLAPFLPCAVAAAPGVLTSLLLNLIRNAIKYGGGPPQEIEIRVQEEDGRVQFEVEDGGPGIPPDLREKIFEPHVRAHGTTKPGIGLGLATVKRLALSHGGEVGVRPKPGGGSVFWFKLPRTDLP